MKAGDFGDFVWGAATSAYQIEGAIHEDGKTDSIWDVFTRKKRKIKNGDTAIISADHYHKFQQDIDIMKSMGLKAYRFSISWPRIFPHDNTIPNQKGLYFYNRLIDALLTADITPYLTIYHWDLPQYLEDKGGWQSRDIIEWLSDYTGTLGKTLGDRVKHWMIINEAMVFLSLGYLLGIHAPGKRGLKKFLKSSHYALLAQAESARRLREIIPDSQIGSVISTTSAYPASDSKADNDAVKRFDALYNRLYLDPVVGRGYPVNDLPVLKKIEKYMLPDDEKKIQFPFNFWGINTYTRKIVRSAKYIPYIKYRELKPMSGTEKNIMGWEIYPPGIYDLLKKFGSYPEIKALYITENGGAFADIPEHGRVHDPYRIKYLSEYMSQVLKAKSEGVPVKGYFAWSLLDNFEWAEGFYPRFGLVYVDYATGERTMKDSAYWYRDFLKT